jgi:hypothetical protein
METRFIVDSNVGKLAKWLRMMGYDTVFINSIDDDELIRIALKEERVLLTKDTQIMKRRVVTSGELRTILVREDNPKEQLLRVVKALNLDCQVRQFTRCLECNHNLEPRSREEVKGLVPPYVFRTQTQYMQCPRCCRIYWRGTHWQRMRAELEKLVEKA